MFVFLPLMAAVALLFYWRPRRLYAEHLALFLHNHAFMFVLLAATTFINAVAAIQVPLIGLLGILNLALFAYLPYYVYRAMRVVYGDGPAMTVFKFATLTLIYLLLLSATMLAGLVYAVLGLS
jgi:hypothetical protein